MFLSDFLAEKFFETIWYRKSDFEIWKKELFGTVVEMKSEFCPGKKNPLGKDPEIKKWILKISGNILRSSVVCY